MPRSRNWSEALAFMPKRADAVRVAVIGGGCGGMAAAFELSRPEHRGRYEVTVYQEGWRLGGKGASGRGPAGRIEEHGLHVWMGFYDNAFGLIRDCYSELQTTGLGAPFGDPFEAFVPENDIGIFSPRGADGWSRWAGRFAPRPGLPGDPRPAGEHRSVMHYLARAIEMLEIVFLQLDVRDERVREAEGSSDLMQRITRLLRFGVFGGALVVAEGLGLLRLALTSYPAALEGPAGRLLDQVAQAARDIIEDRLLVVDDQAHLWELADLVLATIVGVIRDRVHVADDGLDAIDDFEMRDWLHRHGASDRALASPFLRGLNDLVFGYTDGDEARPAIAAGTGLRGWLRMFFDYRGAIFWRMRAGMGDVMFAPLYVLLRERGVRFEYFHRLTDVSLAGSGPVTPVNRTHVESLTFDVQARPIDGYDPLVEVTGRPCWPNQPRWEQLHDGAALAAQAADFESHWDRRRVDTRILRVGEDFDMVVLAVSIGAVPHCAPALVERAPSWRAMVEKVATVETQALQLWLRQPAEALGWEGPPWIVAGNAKPFDTWADMAHVVPEEAWHDPPATVAYFCSVLPHDANHDPLGPDYPARRRADVRRNAEALVAGGLRGLWPGAYDEEQSFRWDLLVDAAEDADGNPSPTIRGPERLAGQYVRANVNPTERYVQSLPGTSRYRISPLDMSVDNLTIAGDWTACGLNTGCAEAAVISGRLAAHAISGSPPLEEIPGFDHP